MKIIDSGNYIPTTYRFHCTICNCVYEADEWELQRSSEVVYTHCPICHNKIPTCYAEILDSTDTLAETVNEKEFKSESTENCCENCAYLGTRDDSSKFCMIPGKEVSDKVCDLYKSTETYKAEQVERTKLKEAAQLLQKYCANNHNCKDCPFSGSMDEGCRLAKTPELWNTDL